jgi:formylglycine-generating enzyme required for sulfatase activity
MAGNVWDWTAAWYTDRHPDEVGEPCCIPRNPRGGAVEDSFDKGQPQFRVPRKVIKGGSYLCADSYCMRYRPAARRPQMIDTGMSQSASDVPSATALRDHVTDVTQRFSRRPAHPVRQH